MSGQVRLLGLIAPTPSLASALIYGFLLLPSSPRSLDKMKKWRQAHKAKIPGGVQKRRGKARRPRKRQGSGSDEGDESSDEEGGEAVKEMGVGGNQAKGFDEEGEEVED